MSVAAGERLILVVLFDGVDLLDVTGPPEVFSLVRRVMAEPPGYRVLLVAETLDPVTTSAGVRVVPDLTFDRLPRGTIDTLVVPGAVTVDEQRRVRAICDPSVVDRVRSLAGRTRRVASVCVGAHILAEAGLLDGKRATTHWSTARQLATENPRVTVDSDPIYIREGDVWTGAGLSACLDLALALVADDFGPELASLVARQLVMFLRRPGGQSQFSVGLEPPSTTRRIDELRVFVAKHLARPLTVADLAEHAHLTERHVTRVFKTELGITPAAYVEQARVEAARQRLESTDDTLTRVAAVCGFGTVSTLSRSFRRTMNTSPTEYRERFRIAP